MFFCRIFHFNKNYKIYKIIFLIHSLWDLLKWESIFQLIYNQWNWINTQLSSVTQSCLTLCDPMNHSMPGLPVYHQLPESTQTHVHWVSDAIQLSHPLSSPSPPALNLSQHQGLFKWICSSHQVAQVLEFQLQHQTGHYLQTTTIIKLVVYARATGIQIYLRTLMSLFSFSVTFPKS